MRGLGMLAWTWWRGGRELRALSALFVLFGSVTAGTMPVAAQSDESGIDDNAYTGVNFSWSLEWDENVWTNADSSQGGGTDLLTLSAAEDQSVAEAAFYGIAEFGGDSEECASGWGDVLANRQRNSDVAAADDVDLPEAPDGQSNAVYTFTYTDGGDSEQRIAFVQCQTLVEDEAVLIAELSAPEADFDAALDNFEDLIADLEVEVGTPEPAEPQGTPLPGSGIDGTTYTSPTYGYSVEWDESVWTAIPGDELIADGDVALDSLHLAHTEGDSYYSDFYIEARTDYEGDPAACIDGEADDLSGADGLVDFAPLEVGGQPVVGETEDGAQFAAFVETWEGDDGEYEVVDYVECRTLEDGESVLVFYLFTSPDSYELELEEAQPVIDSLDF